MAPQLPALEKNVLKFRAFQMILLLHEVESLRRYIISSIRATDDLVPAEEARLPPGVPKPFEVALNVLVIENIISDEDRLKVVDLVDFRNRIGHRIHELVADVSELNPHFKYPCLHDYKALAEVERLRKKIVEGIGQSYIQSVSLAPAIFEQAELTYKEELKRLAKRIERQIAQRLSSPPEEDNAGKPVSQCG